MWSRIVIVPTSVFFLCLTAMAFAIPQLINYQGILLDSNGDPIETATSVVFAIWNDPNAGDSLWSETQSVTPDTLGLFNVLLGSASPIPDSALAGEAYVSVKIEADPEMGPRQRLVSVAYAFRPGTVDGASGGSISGDVEIQNNLSVAGDLLVTGSIVGSAPWAPLPLAAGYEDYEDAHPSGAQRVEYRKVGDIVYVRGTVHKADHGSIPDGAILANLPLGFRPPANIGFYTPASNTNMVIDSDGKIVAYNNSASEWNYLDVITFSTSP